MKSKILKLTHDSLSLPKKWKLCGVHLTRQTICNVYKG